MAVQRKTWGLKHPRILLPIGVLGTIPLWTPKQLKFTRKIIENINYECFKYVLVQGLGQVRKMFWQILQAKKMEGGKKNWKGIIGISKMVE